MGEDSNNKVIINNKEEETTSSNGELLVVVTAAEAAWGTLEELLLVCAVNRHGSKSWDSIATELQKRRCIHNHRSTVEEAEEEEDGVFSADDCRRKYVDLILRYTAGVKTFSGDDDDGGEREEEEEEDKLLRIVEELRKLRVEQLKREVHKHDVSILSLQKKVKKLEEDNKKKNSSSTSSSLLLKPPEIELKPEPSDLRIEPDQNANKTDLPERSSPEKRLGVDSAEDRSVNESNSSKADPKVEQDPVKMKTSRLGESASESKRDDSNNNNNNNKFITSTKLQQQQSSDVQSSASLSKKRRRRFRVGGGGGVVNSSGDELEAEELSPANKRISVKSQPLIRFLDLLRSHKHGSVFHRRLPSQDTEKYRNVVRQHMDLDMVQWRLERGIYSECHHKFYRDLILIFTNAVLFYRKSSAEHIAARELRKLVIEESALRTHKPEPQPKPDPEPQHLEPVVKKPRTASTMVVCRRRSSIQGLSDSLKKKEELRIVNGSTKNSNASNKLENGREEKPKIAPIEKKGDGGRKSINDFTSRIEKEGDKGDGVANSNSKKVLTKERSSLGRGTLRLSDNNGKKIISKDGNSKREKMGSSEGEGDDSMEKKVNVDQKQEKAATTVLKKQGVANFLKRMKQNSPSSQEKAKSNDSDDQEVENGNKVGKKGKMDSNNNSNGKKTGGNVKKNVGKKDVDVVVTRRSSGRRGEKEAATSGRAIGRPPKRKAAMMGGGTPDSAKGGRSGGRDGGEKSRKKARR